MSEFNVLGASDRNKRAIQLALTIPGSKTLAGGASPDLKFTDDTSESEEFKHPFKMSIIDNEGDKYLNIQEGRITISNNTTDRTWVGFFGENALDLSELSTSGEFYVVLALKYDPSGIGDEFDNTYFSCNVYFVKSDATTNLVPGTRGFQTTLIGKIKKEIIEEEEVISITRQDLISDLFLEFNSLNHPFSITAYSDAFENGTVKNTYSLSDFEFHVQEGTAIIKDTEVDVQEDTFTASQNTYVYCSVDESTLSASIVKSTTPLQYFNSQNKTYNHCIGYISFDAQNYGIMIQQFIHSTIGGGGSDTYKVKTISGDAQPDFLSAKFEFQEESQSYPLSSYQNSLIGGMCKELPVSDPNLSGNQYKVKPIWMYKQIDDYDRNEEQYLLNDKGNLKWKGSKLEISGSLSNWEEIKNLSNKRVLRWKPEYDLTTHYENFYFMVSAKNGSGLSSPSVLSGLTFGTDANKKHSVMIWDNQDGIPIISTPPAATPTVPKWVMTGNSTSGINWSPYVSGNISLSGSIENVFELVDGTSGKVLRVKSEYDGSIDQFHFLNLEADGTLSETSFFGDPTVDGECSIMTWNYDALEPQVVFCPAGRQDDDFILAGSKKDGLYWVGLYAAISSEIMELSSYLSGELYKVKASVQDPSGDFLYSKVASVSSSILLSLEQDVDQYVNFEINPDYFYSSDSSISIEETEDGLDFTISSAVVSVSEGDDPDFLFDKITSETASISASIVDSGEYEQVSLDINPAYFYSSDGTISIEETENGLDFTLSSAVVSATRNDDNPDVLDHKIQSPTSTINIAGATNKLNVDLNTSIFSSQDGTLSINATSGNVDFSVSGLFKVKINQNDGSPDYLANKLTVNAPLSIQASGGRLVIGLDVPSGAGLLYINDGQLSVIPIGTGVAVGDGSTLTFEEPEDCE